MEKPHPKKEDILTVLQNLEETIKRAKEQISKPNRVILVKKEELKKWKDAQISIENFNIKSLLFDDYRPNKNGMPPLGDFIFSPNFRECIKDYTTKQEDDNGDK